MYRDIWEEVAIENRLTIEETISTLKKGFKQEESQKIEESTLQRFKKITANLNKLLTNYFNPPPEEWEDWPILEKDDAYEILISEELALLYEPYRQEDDEDY